MLLLGRLHPEDGWRPGVVDLAIRFAADGSRTMRRFRSHQRLQVTTSTALCFVAEASVKGLVLVNVALHGSTARLPHT